MRHWGRRMLWHQPHRRTPVRRGHDAEQCPFLALWPGVGHHCGSDAASQGKTQGKQVRVCHLEHVRPVVPGLLLHPLCQLPTDGRWGSLHPTLRLSSAHRRHHGHFLQGKADLGHGTLHHSLIHRGHAAVLDARRRPAFSSRCDTGIDFGPHLRPLHHRHEPVATGDVIFQDQLLRTHLLRLRKSNLIALHWTGRASACPCHQLVLCGLAGRGARHPGVSHDGLCGQVYRLHPDGHHRGSRTAHGRAHRNFLVWRGLHRSSCMRDHTDFQRRLHHCAI